MKMLLPLMLMLPGCTLPSTLHNRDTGEWITLGGSLGTRTQKEQAVAVSSTGTMISYGITGKDETIIARDYFLLQGVGELATAARQAYQSSNITRRALGAQQVQKVGIRADKAVRLKALEALEPEVMLLPAP